MGPGDEQVNKGRRHVVVERDRELEAYYGKLGGQNKVGYIWKG